MGGWWAAGVSVSARISKRKKNAEWLQLHYELVQHADIFFSSLLWPPLICRSFLEKPPVLHRAKEGKADPKGRPREAAEAGVRFGGDGGGGEGDEREDGRGADTSLPPFRTA